jgi:hypothetical protein
MDNIKSHSEKPLADLKFDVADILLGGSLSAAQLFSEAEEEEEATSD